MNSHQAAARGERILSDVADAVADGDVVRLAQKANAPSPMLVTLSGIMTLVRLVQAENASAPMRVTPPPIVTLLKPVQP